MKESTSSRIFFWFTSILSIIAVAYLAWSHLPKSEASVTDVYPPGNTPIESDLVTPDGGLYGSGSIASSFSYRSDVVDARLVHGTIEIVRRQLSHGMYSTYPPQVIPDTVWKEVYGCVDGEIKFLRRVEGKHIPESVSPERFEFQSESQ